MCCGAVSKQARMVFKRLAVQSRLSPPNGHWTNIYFSKVVLLYWCFINLCQHQKGQYNLYGEDAEKELLKGIIDWHVFETATEPALKNYAFSKWHKACILAQRQIYILEIFVSHHPSATKAKEWLKEWKPRLQDMETDCE